MKYNDVKVYYSDSTEVICKPVSNENIDVFRNCIQTIVTSFYRNDGAIRDCLSDEEVANAFESACSVIPVKNVKSKSDEVQYLEWEKIKDNYEQLIVLFCNSSLKPDRSYDTSSYKSGLIVQQNFISTSRWVSKATKEYEESLKQILKNEE